MLLPSTADAGFFATRNQNPFTLFQGQPLPLPARPREQTGWSYSTSLDITNTLNLENASGQSLLVDYEAYHLGIRLERGLAKRWSVVVDLPLMHRGGGALDNAIDSWHDLFGLPRANRPLVADNQYDIRYSNNGTDEISLDRSATSAGDIALHLGYALITGDGFDAAAWAGLELPTGDRAELTGNDATDAHLSLALAWRPAADWRLDANLGAVLPGGDLFSSNPARDSVLYAYTAANWALTEWLTLRVQIESHQAYFEDDSLDMLDKANVIVFGGAVALDGCHRLDIGVSEDIDVGSSPDVSFLFTLVRENCD